MATPKTEESKKPGSITILKRGVSTNGQHWTMLNKRAITPFGTQILTGFLKTESECLLKDGETTDVEPTGIDWKA